MENTNEKYLHDYLSKKSPIFYEIKKTLGNRKELTIFDIGSCEGEDSIRYALEFPQSTIYAFEPLPQNQKIILQNIQKASVKNNIILEPFALSDNEGEFVFFVSDSDIDINANKSSSLLKPKEVTTYYEHITFETQIKVSAKKLENYLSEKGISEIDLVHMDVQGAELKVLNGAGEKIKNIKAIWLEVAVVEMYEGQCLEKDVDNFLLKKGFVPAKRWVFHTYGDKLYLNKKYFSWGIITYLQVLNFCKFWTTRVYRMAFKRLRLLFK